MKNTPEIRFKGFTDAWVQRKLGEVFKQTVEYVNPKEEDIELWSLTVESGLTPKTERYNREFLVKKEDAFKVVLPDEFIYNPMNITLGSVDLNLTNKKVAVSGYYITMRTVENHNNNYFAVWLKSPKAIKLYKLYATGGLLEKQRVQFPSLSQIETTIPVYKEQTAIGNFFRTLDSTIVLYKRKAENLKQLKKAYLQQMFPQEGETVPRIRFAGFTGEWEVRLLGKHTKLITKGTTPENRTVNGLINFIKVENISNGKISPNSKITKEEHEGSLKRSKLEESDIIISIAGTLGRTAIVKADILPANTNQALAIIRGYDFDSNFLFISLHGNAVADYIRKNPTIGAQPNLSLEQIGNLTIWTPKLKEQTTIGNFFRNLDEQINLYQTKLDNLKQLKSAYLQKMFV